MKSIICLKKARRKENNFGMEKARKGRRKHACNLAKRKMALSKISSKKRHVKNGMASCVVGSLSVSLSSLMGTENEQ